MNVQRFTGRDNRAALDQVRQHLGPDALVLSSQRTGDGIEICATTQLPDMTRISKPSLAPNTHSVAAGDNEIQLAQLKRELASLRETLQQALGERRWQDTAEIRPVAASVAQRLVTLGLGRVLAGELADRFSHIQELNAAWQQVTQHLMERLNSLSCEELGGFRIKAIIGGSGSGKTHAAAALLQVGLGHLSPEQIALVHCGDPSRDTTLSQLATRLNIRQYSARSHDELAEALSGCRWARDIIIDTPALSPALGSQDPVLTLLSRQRGGLAAFVALPATASSDHLREMLDHSRHLPLAGVITTKVDEANSLGAVIDAVVTSELALAGRYDVRTNSLLPVSGDEMLTNAKRFAKRSLERQSAQLKVAV
ncbi:MAG: hypothetical protein P8O91_07810 [Luminiphilus sp.]|nr:hypothetical protein [Luminiphilus sp.]